MREFVPYELGARVLMLIVAFVPVSLSGKIGRILGAHKPAAMFFFKREARGEGRRSTSRPSIGGGIGRASTEKVRQLRGGTNEKAQDGGSADDPRR